MISIQHRPPSPPWAVCHNLLRISPCALSQDITVLFTHTETGNVLDLLAAGI